jgi:hypothetical protein
MPVHLCPRCQRANPAAAVYCHFDGTPLAGLPGQGWPAPGHLPHPFVFPSGRSCRTFDELVQACQEEWVNARLLLAQGVFAQFLAAAGRMDLSQAAQKAQAHQDPDIGLHVFLSGLPASKMEGPRLDLKPRRLALGQLRPGEIKQVRLIVSNTGKGLLHGTLSVAVGEEWLKLEPAPNVSDGHCTLKTAREQIVVLSVDTRQLTARQAYLGKLTVITNGGIVEVPVSLEAAVIPFHRPPYVGASSPREIAERMRAQPKPAVPLLEGGEIARWFTANGWVYPVPSATARGVAAVQQFFEGMGLSKPPPLALSDTEARYALTPPDLAQGRVTLRTASKKWVYASADSDAPWLRVTTPDVSGPQQAVVEYEVDSSLLDPGTHEGTVRLTANADQKLSLRVVVEIEKPHEPWTRKLLRPFFAGAILFLLYRLLLAVPADLFARVLAVGGGAGGFETWLDSPLKGDTATMFVRHVALASWWLGAVAGAVVLWQRGREASAQAIGTRLADLACGIIAGAVAGLVVAATLACALPALDYPARLVWLQLAEPLKESVFAKSPWVWTPAWVLLAAVCWAAAGALVGGLLRLLGATPWKLLTTLALPLSSAAKLTGFEGVAAYYGE